MTEPRKGYADIAAYYRAKIRSGELQPGDPMPTLDAAKEERGVSRNTVVRAYDLLKREGYIRSRPGAGTEVAAGGVRLSGSDRLARVERGEDGYLPGEVVTERHTAPRSVYDRTVAEALGVELGDEVCLRTRVYVREGRRFQYATSAYHVRALQAVPELADQAWSSRDWRRLHEERTGRNIYETPKRYGARIALPEELAKFHLFNDPTAARAVLVVTTQFSDETGPLAVWEDIYAPGETIPAPSPE